MADVTRDSYNESARYVEVVFQRGKDVLDAELNELQRNSRVNATKKARVLGDDEHHCLDDGFLVFSDGVTANQLEVTAGLGIFGGYAVELDANSLLTGLSTPVGAQTDIVWISLTEQEVDSVADTAIAVSQLGETSVRTQLVVAFGVAEGVAIPADSGGEPWEGGTRYFPLATVYRAAVAIVATDRVIDVRRRPPSVRAAQDRGVSFYLSSDGYVFYDAANTTVEFKGLNVFVPGTLDYFQMSGVQTVTGLGVGNPEIIGFKLRRGDNAAAGNLRLVGTAGTVDHQNTKLELVATEAALLDDDLIIVAHVLAGAVVLVNGVFLDAQERTYNWNTQPREKAALGTNYEPIKTFNGIGNDPNFLVDHNGFPLGDAKVHTETWDTDPSDTNQALWVANIVATGAVTKISPSVSPVSNLVSAYPVALTIAAVSDAAKLYSDLLYKCNDAGIFVVEFVLMSNDWTTKTNRLQFGVTSDSGGTDPFAAGNDIACFCQDTGNVFNTRTGDGVSTTDDLAVLEPTDGVFQYYRIEMYGADQAGATRVDFFQGRDPEAGPIATHTTNLPVGDAGGEALRVYAMNNDPNAAGVATVGHLYISMIRWAYRPFPPLGSNFAM